MTRSIVLVGLPGSGKSSVGAALAARLGWPFVDLDREIERQAGQSVAELFRTGGESAFRQREASVTRQYVNAGAMVISPGGGWMCQPGLPALLRPTSRIIHLVVSPEEAVRRLAGGRRDRPLLADAADPVAAVRRLAEERAPHYAAADAVIDTDGRSVAEVVDAVLALEGVPGTRPAPPVAHFNE